MSEGEMALAVLGLVALSALTRSAFFLSRSEWTLPGWAERGLKYAPLAALAAKLPGTPARKAHSLLRTLALTPEQGFFLTNSFFNPLLWQN